MDIDRYFWNVVGILFELGIGLDMEWFTVTSKGWISNAGEEKAARSIDESLRKLRTDYIDLLLIRQPLSDYGGT